MASVCFWYVYNIHFCVIDYFWCAQVYLCMCAQLCFCFVFVFPQHHGRSFPLELLDVILNICCDSFSLDPIELEVIHVIRDTRTSNSHARLDHLVNSTVLSRLKTIVEENRSSVQVVRLSALDTIGSGV